MPKNKAAKLQQRIGNYAKNFYKFLSQSLTILLSDTENEKNIQIRNSVIGEGEKELRRSRQKKKSERRKSIHDNLVNKQ